MTKDEFVAQLDRASVVTGHLPVTSALIQHLAAQLKKGDPPWWGGVQKAWDKRKFVSWAEAWWLFLTCVHYEVLSDAQSPLVPYFPSCGGTPEADPSGVFAKFLSDLQPSFFEKLKKGLRRSYGEVWAYLPTSILDHLKSGQRFNEVWAPLWLQPAEFFFKPRRLPFYLVEVNAGAGLNLAADLVFQPKGFESSLVAARIGLDESPLLLEDMEHRRWLTASIPPEQMPIIAALDDAIEKVLDRQRREATFIQLVPCKPDAAPAFIAKNIPPDDADVGLLVLNIGMTAQMGDAEYEAYKKNMLQMMRPWGDRALWLEFEKVRAEMYSTTYELKMHKMSGDALSELVFARSDVAAGNIKTQTYLKAADEFLFLEKKKR